MGFEKEKGQFQYLKIVKLKICPGKKASCFVSSGDYVQTFQAVAFSFLPFMVSFCIPDKKSFLRPAHSLTGKTVRLSQANQLIASLTVCRKCFSTILIRHVPKLLITNQFSAYKKEF